MRAQYASLVVVAASLATVSDGITRSSVAVPTRRRSAIETLASSPVTFGTATPADDERLRTIVPGRWKLIDHGVRIVDNRDDGTAVMDVKFDFLASLLYGPAMTLELTWTIENGILTYTIVAGRPTDMVQKMIDDWGAAAAYHFARISNLEMKLVRTTDPNEIYLWKRLDEESAR